MTVKKEDFNKLSVENRAKNIKKGELTKGGVYTDNDIIKNWWYSKDPKYLNFQENLPEEEFKRLEPLARATHFPDYATRDSRLQELNSSGRLLKHLIVTMESSAKRGEEDSEDMNHDDYD
jgi:hypothetical protein